MAAVVTACAWTFLFGRVAPSASPPTTRSVQRSRSNAGFGNVQKAVRRETPLGIGGMTATLKIPLRPGDASK
jgi:hypothetical protein